MISVSDVSESHFKSSIIKGKVLSQVARYFRYCGEKKKNVPPVDHSFNSEHSANFIFL